MAGTKRNQHAIEALKQYDDVTVRVIVLRQSTEVNQPSGIHDGVEYETVGPDLWGAHFLLRSPVFFQKSRIAIRNAFRPNAKNILMVYGWPTFENMPMILQARKCGYKVVFDIVEDYNNADDISSLWHKGTNASARFLSKGISKIADGIIVISSHLERKFKDLTREKVPFHRRLISVDTIKLRYVPPWQADTISLFYAGSFGTKDGVTNLLEAFDLLASKHAQLRLILSGVGEPDRMKSVQCRIECSPYRDRITYTGYLTDSEYLSLLSLIDIPCMTRVNSRDANAGFPFKLGEFLASGKPVIASLISDVGSLLSHRENAFLIMPGSVKGIVFGIEYLLCHKDEAVQIGKRGRQIAQEQFDTRAQGHKLYEFLQAIAGKS
jgi:glycosyltransferase involved in cell wall biosynthesis